MKKSTTLFKAAILTVILVGIGFTSYATSYTAAVSGNWTSAATWGVTGSPAGNITAADAIIIPIGITVTLDTDVIMNNAGATLAVAGSLTGTLNLSVTAGTLSGAGRVTANRLSVGAAGLITSTGTITANVFTNSALALSLTAPINVADSVILYSGVVNLGAGAIASLANNVTINLWNNTSKLGI